MGYVMADPGDRVPWGLKPILAPLTASGNGDFEMLPLTVVLWLLRGPHASPWQCAICSWRYRISCGLGFMHHPARPARD